MPQQGPLLQRDSGPPLLGNALFHERARLKPERVKEALENTPEEDRMKFRTLDPMPHRNPRTHAPLDRRDAERAPVACKIIYTGTEGARIIRIEGSLQDISQTGCKILGKTPPVSGCVLSLLLCLEDGKAPLLLTGAHVTWVKGCSFAVRFPRLTPEERKRLQEIIWRNVTLSATGHHRAAFRLA